MISQIQQQFLFELAIKQGVSNQNISGIRQAYQDLLGVSDIGEQKFGQPMAPIYEALPGQSINVSRISKYFDGLDKDLQVLETALGFLEDSIISINLEFWTRLQNLKARANTILETSESEQLRASLGASWSFSESFNNTNYIDLSRTTAAIDVSQGAVYLPQEGPNNSINPSDIKVTSLSIPTGGSLVGSNPSMAFDGLQTSNWRVLFVLPDTEATCVVSIPSSQISAITVEPVGYGINLTIQANDGNGLKNVVQSIIYSKTTFPIGVSNITELSISFSPIDTSLPKAVGLSQFIIFTSSTIKNASLYSLPLQPNQPYSLIKLLANESVPNHTAIKSFYSLDNINWNPLSLSDWHSVTPLTNTQIPITPISFANSNYPFSGVFAYPISTPPSTNQQGTLEVGVNQIEVVAFNKNWTAVGQAPKQLSPSDFSATLKTWSNVPSVSIPGVSGQPRLLQGSGSSNLLSSPYNLTKTGNIILNRTNQGDLGNTIQYNELVFLPFNGQIGDATLQPNYNYKFSFRVYCENDFSFSGNYWFIQGFRNPNTSTYKNLNKSYGSFTYYINGSLIAGSTQPFTAYSDNSIEDGALLGIPLNLNLKQGWNSIEILISITDPQVYPTDVNEVGGPYLQLSLYPSIYDPDFQVAAGITKLLASGIKTPVDQFDLIWNLPKDFTYWAWNDLLTALLFNVNNVRPIDNYFPGTIPYFNLDYQGIMDSQSSSPIYLRFDLESTDITSPILDNYQVIVS